MRLSRQRVDSALPRGVRPLLAYAVHMCALLTCAVHVCPLWAASKGNAYGQRLQTHLEHASCERPAGVMQLVASGHNE